VICRSSFIERSFSLAASLTTSVQNAFDIPSGRGCVRSAITDLPVRCDQPTTVPTECSYIWRRLRGTRRCAGASNSHGFFLHSANVRKFIQTRRDNSPSCRWSCWGPHDSKSDEGKLAQLPQSSSCYSSAIDGPLMDCFHTDTCYARLLTQATVGFIPSLADDARQHPSACSGKEATYSTAQLSLNK
jgi:hypothetical protein